MIRLTLFSQLLIYLPRNILEAKTFKFKGDTYNAQFTTKIHLTVLLASQMKGWKSLREIETGFLSNENHLYHLGMSRLPKRSTLSDANNSRDYRIFEEIFFELLKNVSSKLHNSKRLLVKKQLNIFDSTVISLSIELFQWTRFRRGGGFKIHTTFNVQSQTPMFANVTHGNIADIEGLDPNLDRYSNSILVFDKGYSSFYLFNKLNDLNISFVTRLKRTIRFTIIQSKDVNKDGVITDQIVQFTGDKVKRNFKGQLRLVRYFDKLSGKTFDFLSNNFTYSPKTIAYLYRKRWEMELFFKWIKQNLVIKKYLGYSRNAVNIQVWTALISYLLLIYVKESINFAGDMLEFSRLVRETLFEDIGLIDLGNKKFISKRKEKSVDPSQAKLF